jgi:hypothetical protein
MLPSDAISCSLWPGPSFRWLWTTCGGEGGASGFSTGRLAGPNLRSIEQRAVLR